MSLFTLFKRFRPRFLVISFATITYFTFSFKVPKEKLAIVTNLYEEVKRGPKSQGTYFRIPFFEKVFYFDDHIHTSKDTICAITKDSKFVEFGIDLESKIDELQLIESYSIYKSNFFYHRDLGSEIIREAASYYSSNDLKEKSDEILSEIKQKLNDKLNSVGLKSINLDLKISSISDSFNYIPKEESEKIPIQRRKFTIYDV
eukprot:TRINITY_DN4275_c0_g2_i1.p1 TRINITY_DN4275_c0_g2~~TRINITY_DN4275_c0_g2_i1.p1  ORF type:complete len:202 (-),score=68.24 TRINITY_DN4275_c0_g2_i1:9-614(-)